jgi:hypothetical protein
LAKNRQELLPALNDARYRLQNRWDFVLCGLRDDHVNLFVNIFNATLPNGAYSLALILPAFAVDQPLKGLLQLHEAAGSIPSVLALATNFATMQHRGVIAAQTAHQFRASSLG